MSLQVASIMAPTRKNAPRCTFINTHGFSCPNYVKHTYNGKEVCNIHLNTLKANDDCTICLTAMDNPMLRIKLGCGHYFHTNCLGQCVKAECPLCRREMLPTEKRQVFLPTRVVPLFDPVFSMESSRQTVIFDMVKNLVDSVDSMTDDEVDIYRAFINCFTRGMRILNNAPILENPSGIMFDWMTAMGGAFTHLATYGSYNGFMMQSNYSSLSWGSHPPVPQHPGVGLLAPIQVIPPRSHAPSPELPESHFGGGFVSHQVSRSPSPVLPWYYH